MLKSRTDRKEKTQRFFMSEIVPASGGNRTLLPERVKGLCEPKEAGHFFYTRKNPADGLPRNDRNIIALAGFLFYILIVIAGNSRTTCRYPATKQELIQASSAPVIDRSYLDSLCLNSELSKRT